MSKVNCRECDICGVRLGSRDAQAWIRPRVKYGAPGAFMTRYDVCDECFAKLCVLIQHPEFIELNANSVNAIENIDSGTSVYRSKGENKR